MNKISEQFSNLLLKFKWIEKIKSYIQQTKWYHRLLNTELSIERVNNAKNALIKQLIFINSARKLIIEVKDFNIYNRSQLIKANQEVHKNGENLIKSLEPMLQDAEVFSKCNLVSRVVQLLGDNLKIDFPEETHDQVTSAIKLLDP